MDKKNSGVGVLDKAVTILSTLESGPHSLAELVAATGIARPTAHRLAVASSIIASSRVIYRDVLLSVHVQVNSLQQQVKIDS